MFSVLLCSGWMSLNQCYWCWQSWQWDGPSLVITPESGLSGRWTVYLWRSFKAVCSSPRVSLPLTHSLTHSASHRSRRIQPQIQQFTNLQNYLSIHKFISSFFLWVGSYGIHSHTHARTHARTHAHTHTHTHTHTQWLHHKVWSPVSRAQKYSLMGHH